MVYRVATVNAGGFEVASRDHILLPFELPPPQILEANFDSRTATAALQWTPYVGPRFAAYEVRRSHGEDRRTVAQIADSTATTFVGSQIVEGSSAYCFSTRRADPSCRSIHSFPMHFHKR